MRVVGREGEAVHGGLAGLEGLDELAALAAPALDQPVVAAAEQHAAAKEHVVHSLRVRLQLVHHLATLHIPHDDEASV